MNAVCGAGLISTGFGGYVCRAQCGHQVLFLEEAIVGSQVDSGIPDETLEFAVEPGEFARHEHVPRLKNHCPPRLLGDAQKHLEAVRVQNVVVGENQARRHADGPHGQFLYLTFRELVDAAEPQPGAFCQEHGLGMLFLLAHQFHEVAHTLRMPAVHAVVASVND
jgi:hypothetical protein